MELHNAERSIGRILTSQEVAALFDKPGQKPTSGLRLLNPVVAQHISLTSAGMSLPACVARPKKIERSDYPVGHLNRSDIRVDPINGAVKEGLPLWITLRISDITSGVCTPLEGARVDIWHCDAQGHYSGVRNNGCDARSQYWLRGYQITNEIGEVKFLTIYPGWHPGRAVHICFQIRTDPGQVCGYQFTEQFFFPDSITDLVHDEPPYSAKGYRDILNDQDNVFQRSERSLVLEMIPHEEASQSGLATFFDIGLDICAPIRAGNTQVMA